MTEEYPSPEDGDIDAFTQRVTTALAEGIAAGEMGPAIKLPGKFLILGFVYDEDGESCNYRIWGGMSRIERLGLLKDAEMREQAELARSYLEMDEDDD